MPPPAAIRRHMRYLNVVIEILLNRRSAIVPNPEPLRKVGVYLVFEVGNDATAFLECTLILAKTIISIKTGIRAIIRAIYV